MTFAQVQRIIQIAMRESKTSSHKQHQVAAVITYKGRVLSIGVNNPLQWRKNLHPKFKRWAYSIHAEAAAILNMRVNNIPLNRCEMVIARSPKTVDAPRMALPCTHCMAYLKYCGIRRIYYTTGENTDGTSGYGVMDL